MNFSRYRQLSLLLYLCVTSEGWLLISPSEEVLICEGEPLELICTTNATFLRWLSLLRIGQERAIQTYSRYISYADESEQASSFVVTNYTSFNVSRVSHQRRLPLVSRLIINTVTIGLNGTKVNCTEPYTPNIMMASTTVSIIGENSYSNHPKVNTSVEYGTENANVSIEWIPESHTLYNVSVKPHVSVTSLLSSAQFTVPYNTHFNVSIVAIVCEQYTTTTIIGIHYAKCDYPFQATANAIQVVDYINPSLEGATINFTCPTGMVLTGPKASMATCMSNGEWEPDPNKDKFKCKVNCGPPLLPPNGYVVLSNDTMEGSSISFICLTSHSETATIYTTVCNQTGVWEPHPIDVCQLDIPSKNKPMLDAMTLTVIISLISMSILTSILFFLFGYACGWRQRYKTTGSVSERQTTLETSRVYERAIPNIISTEQVELELTKNEAYASLNIRLSQS